MAEYNGVAPRVSVSEIEEQGDSVVKISNATAIVGVAIKGPLELTLVSSVKQAINLFGNPIANNSAVRAMLVGLTTNKEVWFQRVISKNASVASTFSPYKFVADEALTLTKDTEGKKFSATLSNKPLLKGSTTVFVTFDTKEIVLKDNQAGKLLCDKIGYEGTVNYVNGKVEINFDTVPTGTVTAKADYKYKKPAGVEPWIKFNTKDLTSYYNDYKISLKLSTDDPTKIVYTLANKDGDMVETYRCSIDPKEISFIGNIINRFSSYVTCVVKDGYTKADAADLDTVLADGNSGLDVTVDDVIGKGNSGMKSLYDPDRVDYATLVVPGWFDKKVYEEAEKIINYRKDLVYLPSLPFGLTPEQARDYVRAYGEFVDTGYKFDNSHIFLTYPNGYIRNAITGQIDLVDITPYIAATFTASDNVSHEWISPAGVNRGKVVGLDGLEYSTTKEQRDMLYSTDTNINSVVDVRGKGLCLMGVRTSKVYDEYATNKSLRYINARRLSNYFRKVILRESLDFLFDQNELNTWNRWKLRLDPYFRAVKESRGIYDYILKMDETTVSQEDIDNGRMPGLIKVAIIKPAEYIDISYVLSKDGITSYTEEDATKNIKLDGEK